jgi:general stress protein 26
VLLENPPLCVAVEGTARNVRDGAFADHWSSDLERWFPKGIDTEGMMIEPTSMPTASTALEYDSVHPAELW